jgi:hypothetical protein
LLPFQTERNWATYVVAAVCALFFFFTLLLLSGVNALQAFVLSGILIVNVVSTGFLWQFCRGTVITIAEFLGAGIVGTIIVGLCLTLIFPPTLIPVLFWMLTPLIAILSMVFNKSQQRAPFRLQIGPRSLFAGLIAIAASLFLNRYQFGRYDLGSSVDYSKYHPDLLFHQALTNAITEIGPGENGLLSDWPIRYHWFSHAVASAFEQSAGLGSFVALTRLIPFIAICAMAFIGAMWASSLTKQKWIPLVAALTLTTGKFVADSAGVQVNWDSPSQTLSIPLLLFAGFVIYLLCNDPRRWLFVPMLIVISSTLVGTKISTAFVLLVGLLFLAVVGMVTKAKWTLPVIFTLFGSSLAAGLVYFLFISGQSDSGGLVLRGSFPTFSSLSNDAALSTTFALIPGWLGVVYLSSRRLSKWQPVTALGIGVAVGGLIPLWLLQIEGPNSLWFLTSATSLVWLVSIVGGGQLADKVEHENFTGKSVLAPIAFLVAVISAVIWGATSVLTEFRSVSAQVIFILVLVGFSLSAAIILSAVKGFRLPVSFIVIFILAGTLSPIAMNASNFIFPQSSLSVSISSEKNLLLPSVGSTDLPQESLDPSDLVAITAKFANYIQAGDEVAFTNEQILPLLLETRAKPFAISEHLATGLGPVGSTLEFDRREGIISDAISDGTESAIEELCNENVNWIIVPLDKLKLNPQSTEKISATAGGMALVKLNCA